jgi:hypothetical protein
MWSESDWKISNSIERERERESQSEIDWRMNPRIQRIVEKVRGSQSNRDWRINLGIQRTAFKSNSVDFICELSNNYHPHNTDQFVLTRD